jgi:hypothetical protein
MAVFPALQTSEGLLTGVLPIALQLCEEYGLLLGDTLF